VVPDALPDGLSVFASAATSNHVDQARERLLRAAQVWQSIGDQDTATRLRGTTEARRSGGGS
jgi:hypothetical protein